MKLADSWADIAEEKAEVTSLPMELPDILEEVRVFLSRYIVFSNEAQATAVTLWVAHTWVLDAFDYTPYLHISSPVKECGKTILFECLKKLCPSSWLTISPTEAVLFRKIHAHTPTFLLDETDSVFTDKIDPNKEGLRAALNAGYKRGETVSRCHGQSHELKEFSVFCPKAFAGIGNIPETIASRSIKIPLVRRRKSQSIEKFRDRDVEQAAKPIVEALKGWSTDKRVITLLRDARPEMPPGLGDRSEDICEPLFAIAEMAGGDWPSLARKALVQLRAKGDTDEEETKIQLLLAIREIFQTWKPDHSQKDLLHTRPDHISSKDLLDELIDREGEQWAVSWKMDIDDGNTQRPATKLARLLKPFGIVPKTFRESGDTTLKGYSLSSFDEAFARYLPPFSSPI